MSEKNVTSQLIAQWITSIAISVICCAILFDVFAGYLVDIRIASNLTSIRIENLQEKVRQVSQDVVVLQKQLDLSRKDNAAASPPPPPSAGVELTDPAPNEPPDAGKAEAPAPGPAPTPAPVNRAKTPAAPSPKAASQPLSGTATPPAPALPTAPQPEGQTPAQ